ncbi:biosynthetic peptidoglycan transglycosylase [Bacteroides sp. GM023]|uniref:biosynthetic peptidoglycan transglycosylase n=1 Tax=Bacteroides sp. GM023 TaxID=2723058 RepID=UPI00168B9BA8|nr:biosynthetic peptidoglycan transglycosylase [Bacteroides sp. GM023]MBD3592097.1 penicillin-binding protein [Bacteroides sp. GM023]
METSSKKRIVILSAIGILFTSLICLYGFRNVILRNIVNKRTARIEQTHGLRLHYQQLQMKGCNEIALQGLSAVPEQRDTLLKLQSVNVKLNFWKLLKGNIEVRNVRMDGLAINFIKRDTIANYDFLFLKRQQQAEPEPVIESNYASRIDRILNLIYGFLPENGQLINLDITERKDSNFVAVHIPSFVIEKNRFQSAIKIQEDALSQQRWQATGELNRKVHTLKATLFAPEKKKVSLPYITRRFGAEVTFDTLSYSMTKEKRADNQLFLNGKAKVNGLDVYHKALSPEVIHLDRGQLSYQMNVSNHAFELDSTTTVAFNKLQFHPYLRAEKEKGNWHFTAAVDKPWFPADNLFSSLPKGLFNNLEGMKTSGELAYHFLLDIDFAQLDSLKLESELKEKNFRIIEFGTTPLSKMSGEFIYTAYENGIPVRTFPIGPSWEHFTPLDSISPILRMSVMQSEDGAFFYHHGFLPDALREALIYDLQVKRFARGGSTITMQLVKNVFLNRNKNFARKLEEALIVWLIESQRLTSKERMYEVYLNIAEWGPLIYGIREASAFYFNKRPSQLSTQESIFLASIIPKPKHFRSSFTEDGQLKETMEGYYKLIAGRLAQKGLINEIEADSIRPDIQVTGDARNSLAGEKPESSSPTAEEQ